MLNKDDFKGIIKDLKDEDERREKTIQLSREIIKESKIVIVRKFKGNAIVKITGEVKLNNELIGDGYYKIIFKKFDRSSKKKEYIGDKSVFDNLAKDVSDELIKKFDKLVKSKR